MTHRCVSLSAVLLAMSVSPAVAQLNFQHRPTKDPYRNLFAPPPVDRSQSPADGRLASNGTPPQRPLLMCGTLVVPYDPSVDAKIRVGPREDGVSDTMRVVPPPACRQK